jgi:signal transduction histidine kinase
MKLFRGKPGGTAAFLIIAALVAGGLGWATAAALRLEREQLDQRAEMERANLLRLALWRLDSRVAPLLVREDGRPYDHYSAVYAPAKAFKNDGSCWPAGVVVLPSPLLEAELPEWMELHFQIDREVGWKSPQVPPATLLKQLRDKHASTPLTNVTTERQKLLADLSRDLPAADLLAAAREHARPTTMRDTTLLVAQLREEFNNRFPPNPPPQQSRAQIPNQADSQQPGPGVPEYLARASQTIQRQNENKGPTLYNPDLVKNNLTGNGANWIGDNNTIRIVPAPEAEVKLGPMSPQWMRDRDGRDHLVLLRLVQVEDEEVCQGIVLDAERLQQILSGEVQDLFPDSRLIPVKDAVPPEPERSMAALPFQLEPAPVPPPPDPGWTTLRTGLATAWAAALVALAAVALGGWSLIDLSERRIRFVSAVTHELRTPLTTLRLYLDMLTGGMVRDEKQRGEYINTLQTEADRLNRLVGNVLDFSRLENQRPRLTKSNVSVADLLAQVRATWQGRCQDAEKELIVENASGEQATLWTDGELVHQVLGILIDNACKYSRSAEDRRLWVRVRGEEGRTVFEVEDRGPGIPACERRSIFLAFRRGQSADVTAGGVGLGLALARRWVKLLGGRLTLRAACPEGGACFRVELPQRDAESLPSHSASGVVR